MIRAIIVDDETNNRSALRTLLSQHCPQVEIVAEANNIDSAENLIHTLKPQLLLLDVEMPNGTGFDLLKRFSNPDFWIIFVTGFGHYAIQAFRYCALDFLLKPVNYELLIDSVEKVKTQMSLHQLKLEQLQRNLQSPAHQKISIPFSDGMEFVELSDIIRCEANGSYTFIYLKNNKKLYASKNLGFFKDLLPSSPQKGLPCFFRVHHTHLINMFYVKKFLRRDASVKMEDTSLVPVAQRRRTDFLDLLKVYK